VRLFRDQRRDIIVGKKGERKNGSESKRRKGSSLRLGSNERKSKECRFRMPLGEENSLEQSQVSWSHLCRESGRAGASKVIMLVIGAWGIRSGETCSIHELYWYSAVGEVRGQTAWQVSPKGLITTKHKV